MTSKNRYNTTNEKTYRKGCVRVYNRQENDIRIYGQYVYNPHFLDIIAARCKTDIERAKRRLVITSRGKYRYTPSEEYRIAYQNYLKLMSK